jgi:cytochrome c oxidase cbb3-type subunit 3
MRRELADGRLLRGYRFVLVAILVAIAAESSSCERERRDFQNPVPLDQIAITSHGSSSGLSALLKKGNPAEDSAYEVSQGQFYFEQYNCVGCHSHGGGGMGPALMDPNWRYGASPEQVHDSIVNGRPNGMPAFGERIPEFQLWQIVAYVRSMSGQLRGDVAPGREEQMAGKEPESSTPREHLKTAGPSR